MLFIGGALVGILGFTEFYEQLRPLYMAEAMGNITMASVLGIPAPGFRTFTCHCSHRSVHRNILDSEQRAQ